MSASGKSTTCGDRNLKTSCPSALTPVLAKYSNPIGVTARIVCRQETIVSSLWSQNHYTLIPGRLSL